MSFGFPHSFLQANDIDPEMLEFLPEDMRIEILSGVESKFKEWQTKKDE
jgi:hypothetical protein